MQTGCIATINFMKPLKLSFLLLFFPTFFYGQSLTGLWMGKMTNDSNTVRKDDEYEIVLTQYRDKVYGYTRNTFFVDENLYYIVKRVEGTIAGDICEVEDDEILMHNFPQKPEKKVRVVYTFKRNTTDSTWNLDGNWKTNTTKKYYAISGKSELKTERDLSKSKIFPHLEELKKTGDIAFYNEWKKQNENSVAKKDHGFKQEFLKSLVKAEKEKINRVNTSTTAKPVIINTTAISSPDNIAIKTDEKKSSIVNEKLDTDKKELNNKQQAQINTSAISSSDNIAIKTDEKKSSIANEKLDTDKKELNNKQPAQVNTSAISSSDNIAIKTDEKKSYVTNEKLSAGPSGDTDKKELNTKQPVQINTNAVSADAIAIKPNEKKTVVENEKQNSNVANTQAQNKNIASPPVNTRPIAVPVQQTNTAIAKTKSKPEDIKETKTIAALPEVKSKAVVKNDNTEIKKPIQENNTQTKTAAINSVEKTITPAVTEEKINTISEPVVKINVPVLNTDAAKQISEREFDKPAVIEFSADSLVLALYDNGEVDGDTVSVLLNGEIIIPKQCLKTVAFKKTIYIAPGEFQINIVLYAENLGVYPPNTGLLVIYDGEERHNVRFSADYKRNSAIVLRRKVK